MKADTKTEAAVRGMLDKFAEGYARRDKDAILALFSPDPDMVCIGTGVDEWRVGPAALGAQVDRDLAQMQAMSVTYANPIVSAAGSVAWVTVECTMHVTTKGQQGSLTGRLTAVLEQRDGKWLFAQTHFSLPASGQAAGQSVPSLSR